MPNHRSGCRGETAAGRAAYESYEHCNEEGAEIRSIGFFIESPACNGSVTGYILEMPAKCPNCHCEILEKNADRTCLSPERFPTLDRKRYWLVTCARLFLGLGALQVGNLNEAMRVLQLKLPLFGKYWFVYQKVQSSTGSMLMLL
jgi:hypothetical protein